MADQISSEREPLSGKQDVLKAGILAAMTLLLYAITLVAGPAG